jgi:hypothetical protein
MSQPRELFFQQPEHMPRRAHIFQMKNPFVFMHGKSGEGKFLLREDAVPGLVAEFLSGRKLCCIEDQSYDTPLFYLITQKYPYFPITQEIFFCILDLHRFQMASILGVSTTFLKTHRMLYGACYYWYKNNMSEEVCEQIRSTRDNMIERMKLVGNDIILKILDQAKEIVEKELAEKAVKDKERKHSNSQKRYTKRKQCEVVNHHCENGTTWDEDSLAQVVVKNVGQSAAADAERRAFDGEQLSDNVTDQSFAVIWEPMDTLLDSDDTFSADYLDNNSFCFS